MEDLVNYLIVGGEVFLYFDIEEVVNKMCDCFLEYSLFYRSFNDWLNENFLLVLLEREKVINIKN